MPGKKSGSKGGEWKDISSQVGFFYSPVESNPPIRRPVRRVVTKHTNSNRKFAQSNFRLVLSDVCPESKYIRDANTEMEWEDVVSVEWCIEKQDCCPLCLMPYTAPRVCSCGHCFCYACVKQYLTLQPDTWVKCPVCSVLFDEHSLRPVRFIRMRDEIKTGNHLCMDLVIRSHDSINAFSPDNPRLRHYLKHPIPNADAPDEDTCYCHLLYNTPFYEFELLEQNIKELDDCEREMNLAGEVYLLGSMRFAREDILMRLDALKACYGRVIRPIEPDYSFSDFPASLVDDSFFYYTLPWRLSYQLLPLSFQCLRSFYGNYHLCPTHIQSKILEIDDVDVTTQSCSVDKTIQHLPHHAVIHYVELDVRFLVPDKIDKALWDQVKRRETNRKQEHRHMKMEEKRIDRKVKKEELLFIEEYTPYLLEEEKEQPNTTDSQAFPLLPGKDSIKISDPPSKPASVWNDSSKSVIGVNSSLKSRMNNGCFPTLGSAPVMASKPNMKWGAKPPTPKPESNPAPKKKEKKKPVTLFSFSIVC